MRVYSPLSTPMTDLGRNPVTRLRLALALGLSLTAFGTIGYMIIGRYSLLDAVYMSIITMSTVGYETVKPLDSATKIFTIVFISLGLGAAAWVFTTVIDVFVGEASQRFFARRRMQHKVNTLEAHCIICGYGRIGQKIVQSYQQSGIPFVVIEQAPAQIERLEEQGAFHVEGDAADDEVLHRAGIGRARALIAVTPTDAINTFIVLSARNLAPDLFIIARADTAQNEAKLRRAGASRVISPYILGGWWMGMTALNPVITDFITAMTMSDDPEFSLREFPITADSHLAGKTFQQACIKPLTGALVVAVRQDSQTSPFIPNPPDSMVLTSGQALIAIGAREQLDQLGLMVQGSGMKRSGDSE